MPRCRPISRPQNRGAVSSRARNQIERETIPNYCKLFNEFSYYALRLTFDAERADERKLARLLKRFGGAGSNRWSLSRRSRPLFGRDSWGIPGQSNGGSFKKALFLLGGPRVRILLPPGESPLRTWTTDDSGVLRRPDAPVYQHIGREYDQANRDPGVHRSSANADCR
jgi:hypothetical protein